MRRGPHAAERVQQRRLARAGAADDADELLRQDREGDIAQEEDVLADLLRDIDRIEPDLVVLLAERALHEEEAERADLHARALGERRSRTRSPLTKVPFVLFRSVMTN